jgi:hypothetical protein
MRGETTRVARCATRERPGAPDTAAVRGDDG